MLDIILSESLRTGGGKIRTGIEIKDEFIETNGNWKELLIKTAEYLFENNLLYKSDLPIDTGVNRYLISKEPLHKHREFIKPEELSNGAYIETNWSSKDTVRKIKKLAKMTDVEFEIKGYETT